MNIWFFFAAGVVVSTSETRAVDWADIEAMDSHARSQFIDSRQETKSTSNTLKSESNNTIIIDIQAFSQNNQSYMNGESQMNPLLTTVTDVSKLSIRPAQLTIDKTIVVDDPRQDAVVGSIQKGDCVLVSNPTKKDTQHSDATMHTISSIQARTVSNGAWSAGQMFPPRTDGKLLSQPDSFYYELSGDASNKIKKNPEITFPYTAEIQRADLLSSIASASQISELSAKKSRKKTWCQRLCCCFTKKTLQKSTSEVSVQTESEQDNHPLIMSMKRKAGTDTKPNVRYEKNNETISSMANTISRIDFQGNGFKGDMSSDLLNIIQDTTGNTSSQIDFQGNGFKGDMLSQKSQELPVPVTTVGKIRRNPTQRTLTNPKFTDHSRASKDAQKNDDLEEFRF